MLVKTPRLPAQVFRCLFSFRRLLQDTTRHRLRMICTSSKPACGNKATSCSSGRFKTTVTRRIRNLQKFSSAWIAWQGFTLRLRLSPIPSLTARADRLNPQPLIRSSDRLEKRVPWIVCTVFCVLNLLPSSPNI